MSPILCAAELRGVLVVLPRSSPPWTTVEGAPALRASAAPRWSPEHSKRAVEDLTVPSRRISSRGAGGVVEGRLGSGEPVRVSGDAARAELRRGRPRSDRRHAWRILVGLLLQARCNRVEGSKGAKNECSAGVRVLRRFLRHEVAAWDGAGRAKSFAQSRHRSQDVVGGSSPRAAQRTSRRARRSFFRPGRLRRARISRSPPRDSSSQAEWIGRGCGRAQVILLRMA